MEQVNPNSKETAIKFLGVYFEQDLTFDHHANTISKKLSTALYFLRSAKNYLPPFALTQIYYTLFHSHLVYANQIWGSTSVKNFNNIYRLQKSAIRIINGAKYNAHTELLFKKSNVLPLPLLRDYFALDFMQQKYQNLLPEKFDNQFPTNRILRQNPDRELRNDYDFATLAPRLNLLNRFPIIFLPVTWNNFHHNFQNNETSIIRDRQQFKKSLKKLLMSSLNENYECNRLFCPACSHRVN